MFESLNDNDGDEEDFDALTDEVMTRVMSEVGLEVSEIFYRSGANAPSRFDRQFDRSWNKCGGNADHLLDQLMSSTCTVPRVNPGGDNQQ